MSLDLVRFEPRHLSLVSQFSQATWNRPRTDSFYAWRYLDCGSFHRNFLALQEGRCVAVVSAFAKTFILGGEQRTCLEVFDWYCLPGMKGAGIGGQVMRAMMEEPEPVIAFGGTSDTLARLPHMRWAHIADAGNFDLPIGRELLAAAATRRFGLPSVIGRQTVGRLGAWWYSPRIVQRPARLACFHAAAIGDEVQALYGSLGHMGLLQVPKRNFLAWLMAGYSGIGHFIPLYFHDGTRLKAWSLSRVYRGLEGTVATIVDIFWPAGTPHDYAWAISETVSCLMAFRPQRIATTASGSALQAGLRMNRFRQRATTPVHYWSKGEDLGLGPIEMTHNYADWPIMPYPSGELGLGFLSGDGPIA